MAIQTIVAPSGEIIERREPEIVETNIKTQTIVSMNTALREVVLHGTGTRAHNVPNARGKTGTTSNNLDAWFAGFTPELATVIWVGHENRLRNGKINPAKPYLQMPGATGGVVCCPIWRDFMLKAVPIQQAATRLPAPRPAAATAQNKEEPTRQPETGRPTNGLTGTPGAQPNDHPAASEEPVRPEATPQEGERLDREPPGELPEPSGPGPQLTPPTESPRAGAALRGGPIRIEQAAARVSEPTGRIAPRPAPRPDPGEEYVTVRLCADSRRRAGPWCDSTVDRRMRRRDIPGRCRAHRAPPGESE
jgi:membrane peptidoglycan carboxypeptidase